MSLKTISALLTAVTAVLIVVFIMANPKIPLTADESLRADYDFRRLTAADLKALGEDYVSSYEDYTAAEYPAEMFGWLSYSDDGQTALFSDKTHLGKIGEANCLSGLFIAPLGENRRERVKKFNGQYVKLIGYWHEDTGFGSYPALNKSDNPCENMTKFIAADMSLVKAK